MSSAVQAYVSPIKSIQTLSADVTPNASPVGVTITAVVVAKTFLSLLGNTDTTSNVLPSTAWIQLTSTTNVNVTTKANVATDNVVVKFMVVEFL